MKRVLCAVMTMTLFAAASFPQAPAAPQTPAATAGAPDYIIGPADVLEIVVRNDTSLNATVLVRPDGKITLGLLYDVQAAGLTTIQLGERIVAGMAKFYQGGIPSVTVTLREMKSKFVYIEGRGISKSVMVSLSGPLNVMQLISIAGGLTEYAKGKEVRIFREENGVTRTISFNYETFQNASNTKQNIELRPGDIVDVP
jgi:polysaccharide export outer membrane protein